MQQNSLRFIAGPRIVPEHEEIIIEGIDEDEGDIPEHVIREARERRERIRGGGIGADYIPLHFDEGNAISEGGIKSKRGGNSDSEEPEDHVRLKFAEKTKRFDPTTHSKTLDDDHEEDLHGSNKFQNALLRSKAAIGAHSGSDQLPSGEAARLEAIENAAETAMGLLRQGLDKCSFSLQTAQSNMERSSISLLSCSEKIERIKEEQVEKGRRYVEFQRIRSYIADFCDCISDKMVMIEALEANLRDLRGQLADVQVNNDDAWSQLHAQSEAAVSAVLMALSMGQNEDEVRAAAAHVSSAPELRGTEQVDEFGRSLALQRRTEAEKGKRLQELILESERRLSESLFQGDIGDCSTMNGRDLLSLHLQTMRIEIVTTAKTLFFDTSEEFSSLASLKSTLEGFKKEFPSEYSSAYFPLSNAALFSPFIRLELLEWEPILDFESPSLISRLEKQSWHQELFNFGLVDATTSTGDLDNELIPQIVKQLALPLALEAAEFHWNPLDVDQSQRMANLYEDMLVYCEADEVKGLQDSLTQRIEKAASSAKIPLWPTAVTKHTRIDAEIVQFRCFRKACVLIRSLGCFDGLLPQSWLRQLLLARLVVQQCLPYLRAALSSDDEKMDPYQLATARLDLLTSSLKPSWLLKDTSPLELKPLRDHCAALLSAAKRGGKLTSRLSDVAKRLEVEY
jgi:GC-rich sequence DNA-binding factor